MNRILSRLFIIILAVATMLSVNIFRATEAQAANPIKIVVYGETLYPDVSPIVINSRTLAPMSAIFNALGAHVSWNSVYQEVTAQRNTDTIVLQINNPLAVVNGSVVELDAAPTIYMGRTMVPIAFIALSLGEDVRWDPNTRTIYVGPAGSDNPSNTISEDEAIIRVMQVTGLVSPIKFMVDSSERRNGTEYFIIKAFEIIDNHTSTVGWYYVDKYNGKVYEWDISDDSIHFIG